MVILKPFSKFKLRGTVPALIVNFANFGCQVVLVQVVKRKLGQGKTEQILVPVLNLRGRSPHAKKKTGQKTVSRPCPESVQSEGEAHMPSKKGTEKR